MRGKTVLFALLFVGGITGNALQAEAVQLRQEMDARIGIFDAATALLEYEEKGGRYVIGAEVKTANLFDSFYPFTARYASTGRTKSHFLPELYQTFTQSNSHIRTKKIFYDAAGKAYKRISTKDEKQNTVLIDNVPKNANAADLQTVFAELIGQFRKSGSCMLTREIYDGKKHYRVIVKDLGREKYYAEYLKRTENAAVCSVYIQNLKDNNDNILWDISAEKPINLYIGTDTATKMPYVLEISIDSTPLGALKVTPKSLKIK